jgi:hypothetical protein
MDDMLNVKVWTIALGTFFAVSFVLCVVGGLILPGLPIRHVTLEAVLPGFKWISPTAFALGVIESFAFGAYAGSAFALLHNIFARSYGASSAVSVTRAA